MERKPAGVIKASQANKGGADVDGMSVQQLVPYLIKHWPEHRDQLLSGTYEPQPVKRVQIPKPDGGVRNLDIPTGLDRLVQQGFCRFCNASETRRFPSIGTDSVLAAQPIRR